VSGRESGRFGSRSSRGTVHKSVWGKIQRLTCASYVPTAVSVGDVDGGRGRCKESNEGNESKDELLHGD